MVGIGFSIFVILPSGFNYVQFFVLYYIDLKQSFIPLTSFKDEYARECKQGLDAVVNIARVKVYLLASP